MNPTLANLDDARLTELARERNRRVARWYGIRGGSSRKCAVCYLCDAEITGSAHAARWPITKQALRAIDAHRAEHLRNRQP